MSFIAALFVESNGVYSGLDGVEVWDIKRDARNYSGPYKVIAHPPCERWGRYWGGGPSAKEKRALGDDNGCFASALASVRRWGGVLEHPEASHAWRIHGLLTPSFGGGWVSAGDGIGWTCCVFQGRYGHPAPKATWLYAVGIALPSLLWGKPKGLRRLDEGFHSKEERQQARALGIQPRKRLSSRENISTPLAFRDVLLSMVRGLDEKAVA